MLLKFLISLFIISAFTTDIGMIAYFQVKCPQTWQLYLPAQQRFIFTAGINFTTGSTGGEFQHVLTIQEMPIHTHTITAEGRHGGNAAYAYDFYSDWGDTPHEARSKISSTAGGNAAHNNMPPFLTLIACKKISQNNVRNSQFESEMMEKNINIIFSLTVISLSLAIISIIYVSIIFCKSKNIKKSETLYIEKSLQQLTAEKNK